MLASTAQNYMFITNAWHLKHRQHPDALLPEDAFWMQQQQEEPSDDGESD
jgi:hypothetical protein